MKRNHRTAEVLSIILVLATCIATWIVYTYLPISPERLTLTMGCVTVGIITAALLYWDSIFRNCSMIATKIRNRVYQIPQACRLARWYFRLRAKVCSQKPKAPLGKPAGLARKSHRLARWYFGLRAKVCSQKPKVPLGKPAGLARKSHRLARWFFRLRAKVCS